MVFDEAECGNLDDLINLMIFCLAPIFGRNLLVRVQLSVTPNFTSLGHLELPFQDRRPAGWVGGWILVKIIPIFGLSSSDLLNGDPMSF